MGAVGGSRHYTGGGLGPETGWHCPNCGAENAGPIAQGCAMCGSGRPGYKATAPPPPAPPPSAPPPAAAAESDDTEQLGAFDRWALAHPRATLEEAFTAGYVEGVRDSNRRIAAVQASKSTETSMLKTPEARINRTMTAALLLFRNQVLVGATEEIENGEWMSIEEADEILTQLRRHLVVMHMHEGHEGQEEPEAANA
jgi:hypothetical protein